MRQGKAVQLHLLVIAALLLAGLSACASQEELRLTEVMTSNKGSYRDAYYDCPDWVEVYNPNASDVSLLGYVLTDREGSFDLDDLLPDLTVPAKGYLVIPVVPDRAEDAADAPFAVTSFGLSRDGETLCFYKPSGQLIEKLSLPALPADVSYARMEDGSFGYCTQPTPGEANRTAILTEWEEISGETVRLRLTEVMTASGADGLDFIELNNFGDGPAGTAGLYLSNDPKNRRNGNCLR